MPDIPSRSTSGVRGEGDDYQHLVTLNEALRAVRGNGTRSITVEAANSGNVDDVVIDGEDGTTRYTQVKHAVDGQTPVSSDYLLAPTRKGRRSLLQRFYASWLRLGGRATRPHMRLVTDRDIDPRDPVLKMLDRKSSLFSTALSSGKLREERVEWATHLQTDEEQLMYLLEDLRIETGRSIRAEQETAQILLELLGFNSDRRALDSGIVLVREWVQERNRTLTVDDLAEILTNRIGRVAAPEALLVIEGIDDHSSTEDADVALRFVDLYDGSDSYRRVSFKAAGDWQNQVWPALTQAGRRLRDEGKHSVHVAGAMRLPMWFGAGCALRNAEGFKVSMTHEGERWASIDQGDDVQLDVTLEQCSDDGRMAVVVSIAAEAAEAAASHANEAGIGTILTLSPTLGARYGAVPDGSTAARLAVSIRDRLRSSLTPEVTELHLYLAVPDGLALLLGHFWNRLRPTVVYEDTPSGYVRALLISA